MLLRGILVAGLLAGLTVAGTASAAFSPRKGIYAGSYRGGHHGSTTPRLRVRERPHGPGGTMAVVELLRWSGRLHCPDGSSASVTLPMTAARIGRGFNGFVTAVGGIHFELTGRFTSRTRLRGVVRYRRGKCDTGRVRFTASARS